MSTRPYPLAKLLAGNPHPIVSGVKIGHVHLKVADLDRALAFYTACWGSS
jgi:catechol 2,3-dioxygenase